MYSKYAMNILRMFPIKFLAIKVRTQDRITCIAFSFEFSFNVGASTSHPRLPFVLCCIFEPPASLQHRHPNLNPNRRRRSALTSWLPFELCLFCLGSTWVPLPLHPTPLALPTDFPCPFGHQSPLLAGSSSNTTNRFHCRAKAFSKLMRCLRLGGKLNFHFHFHFAVAPSSVVMLDADAWGVLT